MSVEKVTLVGLEALKLLQTFIPADDTQYLDIRKNIDAMIPLMKNFLFEMVDLQHKSWEDSTVMQGTKMPCNCWECDEESAGHWIYSVKESLKTPDAKVESPFVSSGGVSESKDHEPDEIPEIPGLGDHSPVVCSRSRDSYEECLSCGS